MVVTRVSTTLDTFAIAIFQTVMLSDVIEAIQPTGLNRLL